jgi:hypothetical protein
MITLRFGAGSRTVTVKGETVQRNALTKSQDDKLIRLIKFLTFGDAKK